MTLRSFLSIRENVEEVLEQAVARIKHAESRCWTLYITGMIYNQIAGIQARTAKVQVYALQRIKQIHAEGQYLGSLHRKRLPRIAVSFTKQDRQPAQEEGKKQG